MPRVFLSYASADTPAAESIASAIQREGASVYLDSAALVAGSKFSEQIHQSINTADTVVVLLSENSKRSKFVEQELASALEEKIVVPVLLDKNAKDNWIWPLVADRQAIERADSESIESVALRTAKAIGSRAQSVEAATPTTSGPMAVPPTQADLSALLQKLQLVMPAAPAQRSQPPTTAPEDQLKQTIDLLVAALGKVNQKNLGEVNCALGETIGNLLNGKKTALGIVGAMLTAVLQNIGPDLPTTIPLVGSLAGVGSAAMPVFLAIAAWGVLGKLEKWFQSLATSRP